MLSLNLKVCDLDTYHLPNFAIDASGSFISNGADIERMLINKDYLQGSYAFYASRGDGSIFLSRDPIGARKLFYSYNKLDRTLYLSCNFIRLGKRVGFDNILSVQAGGYLLIYPDGSKAHQKVINKDDSHFNLDRALNNLHLVFKNFSENHHQSAIVCLSGGLDSTLIAYLAKNYFSNLTAICVVFLDDEDFTHYKIDRKLPSNKYLDFDNAQMIAKYLGVQLLPIAIPKSKILENLQDVMFSAQDWRDFNVHCAVLNFAIADYIHSSEALKDALILTGDFMNEVFADYTSENVGDEEYYIQPNISRILRQRFLLKGLDSSDRELGVFAYFGLNCIQPYACTIDEYRKLSSQELDGDSSKYEINGSILPSELLNLVGKSKLRAQSGDMQGGILGYFVKNGYRQESLTAEFQKYFGCSEDFMKSFIYVGSYRTDY